MKKGNLLYGAVGLALGLAVVYVYVYVAGKGWQKSQKSNNGGFLNFEGTANPIAGTCKRRNEDGSSTTYVSQGGSRPCPYGGVFTPKKQTKQVSAL
jgi:hypothetical protein